MLGHLPVSIAVLSAVEALVFFAAVYAAVVARFGAQLVPETAADLPGALWPRALLFSAVMMACFLAFGLYSLRQRARLAGLVLRVAVALLAGFMLTATLFYIVPALFMGRGIVALAAIGGLCGVTVSR